MSKPKKNLQNAKPIVEAINHLVNGPSATLSAAAKRELEQAKRIADRKPSSN